MALTLTGDQGTFSISSGPWSLTADIDVWSMVASRRANKTRPFGYILPKVTLGPLEGEGYLEFDGLDGSTPPLPALPNTTYGTATLGTKSTTQKYVGKVAVWNLQTVPMNSTSGANQRYRAQFHFTAENNTDTITPS